MKRTGDEKNAPSENISEAEQNFLKRFALKKVTVPKDKLQDLVNLTVLKKDDCLEPWINPDEKIAKVAAQKYERLEYRDLSKVMRANMPWWLGTRGIRCKYSGERLVSLVEITEDECKIKKRLEAGVEKDFRQMGSQCSVDVAQILSEGMEVCITDTGPSVRNPTKIANKTASKYHVSNRIEKTCENEMIESSTSDSKSKEQTKSASLTIINAEYEARNVEDYEEEEESDSEEENLLESVIYKAEAENEYKNKLPNSTDMAWIEERLNRVQELLLSLEDLRLQSGCEKCQGRHMGQTYNHHSVDNGNNHMNYGNFEAIDKKCGCAEGSCPSRHSSACCSSDYLSYAKELLERDSKCSTGNGRPSGSVIRARICRCDLDIINNEMSDLHCYLEELAESQCSGEEKTEFEIIIYRLQQIRESFTALTNKIVGEAAARSQDSSVQQEKAKSNSDLKSQVMEEWDVSFQRPKSKSDLKSQTSQNPNNCNRNQKNNLSVGFHLSDTCKPTHALTDSYSFHQVKLEEANSLESFGNEDDSLAESSNADYCPTDTKSRQPMYFDPPAAWRERNQEDAEGGSSPDLIFVPCFYYNPSTGECKFTKQKNERSTQQNHSENNHSCTCDNAEDDFPFKRKHPTNATDLLSQLSLNKPQRDNSVHKNKNKAEREPERSKGKGKENTSVEDPMVRNLSIVSKLTGKKQKKCSIEQNIERCPCNNRYVGEILSENMRVSQQALKTESDSNFSNTPNGQECRCCCKQGEFSACACRARGSGLPKDYINTFALNSEESPRQVHQKFNNPRASTATQPNQEPSRRSTQEVRGRTKHSQESFRRVSLSPQKAIAQELKGRFQHECERRSSLESTTISNQRKAGVEPSRSRSQQLQGSQSRAGHEFLRRQSQSISGGRSQDQSFQQQRRTNEGLAMGMSLRSQCASQHEPLCRTNQGKKKLTFRSQSTIKKEPPSRSNLSNQSGTYIERFIRQETQRTQSPVHKIRSNSEFQGASSRDTKTSRSQEYRRSPGKAVVGAQETTGTKEQMSSSLLKTQTSFTVSNSNTCKPNRPCKQKSSLANELNLKSLKPSVSFRQLSNERVCKDATIKLPMKNVDLSKNISDVCKEICNNTFQQISDSCKKYISNQLCEIPCQTVCDICKNSCDCIIEKLKGTNLDRNVDNVKGNKHVLGNLDRTTKSREECVCNCGKKSEHLEESLNLKQNVNCEENNNFKGSQSSFRKRSASQVQRPHEENTRFNVEKNNSEGSQSSFGKRCEAQVQRTYKENTRYFYVKNSNSKGSQSSFRKRSEAQVQISHEENIHCFGVENNNFKGSQSSFRKRSEGQVQRPHEENSRCICVENKNPKGSQISFRKRSEAQAQNPQEERTRYFSMENLLADTDLTKKPTEISLKSSHETYFQANDSFENCPHFAELNNAEANINIFKVPTEYQIKNSSGILKSKGSQKKIDLPPPNMCSKWYETENLLKKQSEKAFEKSHEKCLKETENLSEQQNFNKMPTSISPRRSREENATKCKRELLKNNELRNNELKNNELKNNELNNNCAEPIPDINLQRTLSRLDSFLVECDLQSETISPIALSSFKLNSSRHLQDIKVCLSDIHATDSYEALKSNSGGDATQNIECQCCFCEGVPPIKVNLGSIIQNRIKNRKRGSVYVKFTMTSKNLFHIQMATVDNEFLACFYATEKAVMEARRTNGFDGCITLSVIEPCNNSSQVNRIVDHAFMVVQQDRKSKP